MSNPLKSMAPMMAPTSVVGEPKTGGYDSGASAIENFRAAATKAAGVDSPREAVAAELSKPESAPDDPVSKLSPEELQEVVAIADHLQIQEVRNRLRDQRRMADVVQARLDRQEIIEEEGVSPMDFRDLLVRDYARQVVQISPRFSMIFRSATPQVTLAAGRVAREMAGDSGDLESYLSLTSLAVGVESLCDSTIGPHPIGDLFTASGENLLKMVRENTLAWSKKPTELVNECYYHLLGFQFRLRKLLAFEGAPGAAVKKKY